LASTAADVKTSPRFTEAVNRGMREGAIILVGVLALMLFAALASYNPQDPGFSFTGDSSVASNLIGRAGAWIADMLFFLFGGPAYLFPLMTGAACWFMFKQRDAAPSRANTAVRLGGFVLLLVASCALATMHWHSAELRQSAGGVVGSLVGGSLSNSFNFLGATLLMLGAWMAGMALAFGVSWLTVIDRLGAWFWQLVEWIKARRSAARTSAEGAVRKQERKDVVEVEQKKVATRVKPRIEAPAPIVEKSERVEKER
jgi:DNA segregation ATPase FtsK/SpoIIIE, S-DNA-T family